MSGDGGRKAEWVRGITGTCPQEVLFDLGADMDKIKQIMVVYSTKNDDLVHIRCSQMMTKDLVWLVAVAEGFLRMEMKIY